MTRAMRCCVQREISGGRRTWLSSSGAAICWQLVSQVREPGTAGRWPSQDCGLRGVCTCAHAWCSASQLAHVRQAQAALCCAHAHQQQTWRPVIAKAITGGDLCQPESLSLCSAHRVEQVGRPCKDCVLRRLCFGRAGRGARAACRGQRHPALLPTPARPPAHISLSVQTKSRDLTGAS